MPPHAYAAVRLLHFLGMALWFAAAATITSDIRRTIARGQPHTEMLASRVERSLSFSAIGAIASIGSGLVMIFAMGGFGAIRPTIHAGFGLALVTLALEMFLLKPTVGRLGEALAANDVKLTKELPGKIGMFAGITHLLKLVILVLMVFRF